jgi:hypothetical protein
MRPVVPGAVSAAGFWDAMRTVPLAGLAQIEEKLALAACARFGLDTSSVALDMTNFATFTGTANGKAPIAQRATLSRSDRICGWPARGWWSPATAASRC